MAHQANMDTATLLEDQAQRIALGIRKQLGKLAPPKPISPQNMRMAMIWFVHANWDKLLPQFQSDLKYCAAEGINPTQYWEDTVRTNLQRKPKRK